MEITLFVLVAAFVSAIAKPELHFLSDEYIEHLNNQGLTWKAGRNFDKDTPLSHIIGLLGVKTPDVPFDLETVVHEDNGEDIPEEFDARKQWPKCESISEIRDQSACASCWAVSSASAISDRVCIASNQKNQLRISAGDLMSCCRDGCEGCSGGCIESAWEYWVSEGIVSGGEYNSSVGCKPYPFPKCDHIEGSSSTCNKTMYPTPVCNDVCDTTSKLIYKQDKHYGNKTYILPNDVRQIQLDIMKNGPAVASFGVYQDFFSYKSGVYKHYSGKGIGLHAMRIIGWGVENKVPYWLVTNSWNERWGDKGLIKVLRGEDECGIESEIVAGLPIVK